jgi:hypothetical protein
VVGGTFDNSARRIGCAQVALKNLPVDASFAHLVQRLSRTIDVLVVVNPDVCAFASEPHRQRLADAGSGAGHQRDFAL